MLNAKEFERVCWWLRVLGVRKTGDVPYFFNMKTFVWLAEQLIKAQKENEQLQQMVTDLDSKLNETMDEIAKLQGEK